MAIFFEGSFEKGTWAGGLADELRRRRFIPDLKPKGRIWRVDWQQWIQYEIPDVQGASFWRGKPAVRANHTSLHAGYYVERGYPSHDNKLYRMESTWHWNGFLKCLEIPSLRSSLNDCCLQLDEKRRCIWLESSDRFDVTFRYHDIYTLDDVKEFISKQPDDVWINLLIGEDFSRKECLALQQKIAPYLQKPMVVAYELSNLVESGLQHKTS